MLFVEQAVFTFSQCCFIDVDAIVQFDFVAQCRCRVARYRSEALSEAGVSRPEAGYYYFVALKKKVTPVVKSFAR